MAKLFSSGSISPMGHQVEKATSGLLMAPDWGSNMDIVDGLNTDPSQTRDVVKVIRKRLQNKDPRVQLLALTLLETMVKNCGEYVHVQVAEKDVLLEMVKIVKKRSNTQVRDRILELLDVWQEAFGGSSGRYPHYWAAYDELRRHGVSFPPRGQNPSTPMFSSPQSQPPRSHVPLPSYGSPGYGSPRNANSLPPPGGEGEGMGLAEILNARSSMEVLSDMLNAVDPKDKKSLSDDIIVDLVEQCQTNQRRIMELVNTTGDEELLRQGLALNDDLQKALSRHESMVAKSQAPAADKPAPPPAQLQPPAQLPRFDHEESLQEEDDDFGQLAHRSVARERLQATPRPVSSPSPPPSFSVANPSADLLSGDFGSLSISSSSPAPATSPSPQQHSYNSQNFGPPSYDGNLHSSIGTAGQPLYSSSPPQVQQTSYPQFVEQIQPPSVAVQQPQQTSNVRASSGGILPIPGPPGSVRSTSQWSQPSPPQPPPQQTPVSQEVENPFDEGNYAAPTFQATAQPPPPPPPPVPQPSWSSGSDYTQSGFPGSLPQQYSNFNQPQSQFNAMQMPPPVENNYVAPWAMAAQQPMTDQQRSYIYGSSQQTQIQDHQNANWSQSSGMGQSPQQNALLYGSPSIPSQSSSLSLPPPPSAAGLRQEYFTQQKQLTPPQSEFQPNNLPFRSSTTGGASLVPSSSASQEKPALGKSVPQPSVKPLTAQQLAKNEDPMKSLFGDLVDLQPAKPKKLGESTSAFSMAASRSNARA